MPASAGWQSSCTRRGRLIAQPVPTLQERSGASFFRNRHEFAPPHFSERALGRTHNAEDWSRSRTAAGLPDESTPVIIKESEQDRLSRVGRAIKYEEELVTRGTSLLITARCQPCGDSKAIDRRQFPATADKKNKSSSCG